MPWLAGPSFQSFSPCIWGPPPCIWGPRPGPQGYFQTPRVQGRKEGRGLIWKSPMASGGYGCSFKLFIKIVSRQNNNNVTDKAKGPALPPHHPDIFGDVYPSPISMCPHAHVSRQQIHTYTESCTLFSSCSPVRRRGPAPSDPALGGPECVYLEPPCPWVRASVPNFGTCSHAWETTPPHMHQKVRMLPHR